MDISARLRGKKLADIICNGHLLKICTDDGAEITLGWLDDNGKLIKGKPAIVTTGVRIHAPGIAQLQRPALLMKG